MKNRRIRWSAFAVFAAVLASVGAAGAAEVVLKNLAKPDGSIVHKVAGLDRGEGVPEVFIVGSRRCPHCDYMTTMMSHLCTDVSCDVAVTVSYIEEHGEALKAYGTDKGVPVQVFFAPDGRAVARTLGAMDPIAVADAFAKNDVKALSEVKPFIERWRAEQDRLEQERLASVPKTDVIPPEVGTWYKTMADDTDPSMTMLVSETCPHCIKMEKMVESLSANMKMNLKVRRVSVNEHQDYADKYVADAVPTLLLFAPDGTLIERVVGGLPADIIRDKFHAAGYPKVLEGYEEYLNKLQSGLAEAAAEKKELNAAVDALSAAAEGDPEAAKKILEAETKGPGEFVAMDRSDEAEKLTAPKLSELGDPYKTFGRIGSRRVLGIFTGSSGIDGKIGEIYAEICAKDGCDTEFRLYDITAKPEIMAKWGVRYFPMLAFADAEGRISDFMIGFIAPQLMHEMFGELENRHVGEE